MSGEMVKFMIKASVSKMDLSKFVDVMRLAKELAISKRNDEKAMLFDRELNGYEDDKDVPPYRNIKGQNVKISIVRIIKAIEMNDNNLEYLVTINGTWMRLRDLKYILIHMENYVWEFIGEVLRDMGVSNFSSSLPELPPELKNIMKELGVGGDE